MGDCKRFRFLSFIIWRPRVLKNISAFHEKVLSSPDYVQYFAL